jgi:hypothetical protein
MPDISPTTNQPYYAGPAATEAIRAICRSINIGEGKLSKITQEMVCGYCERVDRDLDEQLSDLYYTPIKPYNLTRADGTTISVFPGNVREVALYKSAGMLLSSEFQGNEPNLQEAAQEYLTKAQKALFRLIRFNERIFGQEMKSRLRTMLPRFQPPLNPEQDF